MCTAINRIAIITTIHTTAIITAFCAWGRVWGARIIYLGCYYIYIYDNWSILH